MGSPVENGSREAPPVVDVRKINRYRLHRTRIVFRIIALISVFLGLCMDVAVVANALGTDWRLVNLGLSITLSAILWNIAELVTQCVNKRGIYPGVHIGLDLTFFMVLMFSACVDFALYNQYDGTCNGRFCGGSFMDKGFWTVGVAGSVFVVIASLSHFILFVLDCVAVHEYRKRILQTQLFYLTQQPGLVPVYAIPATQAIAPVAQPLIQGFQPTIQPIPHGHVSLPAPPPGTVYVTVPQQQMPSQP